MQFNIKKIKDTRIDNDLSQLELAKILGISENIYCNIENGRTAFPIATAVDLANYFQLSLDYLFGLSNHKFCDCNRKYNKAITLERLLALRRKEKLSQERFGESLNIPQRTYSSYENDERTIPLEILFKIAYTKKCSLDYLTGRTICNKIKDITY